MPMPLLRPLALQVDSLSDAQASVSVQSFGEELKFVSNSYHEYKFTDRGLQKVNAEASAAKFDEVSEDDIEVQELLGEGASATVYKAMNRKTHNTVAVKRINCLEKDKRKQIMNDIRGLCNVSHPSLVQFLGAYKVADSSQISIVLEYMDGGSLADLVKEGVPMPEDVICAVAAQVLEGLAYLHRTRHTLHRDIKPANILLNLDGRVKIADFGISAFVDNTLAVCNTYLGTVTYMSPERINSRPYSFSADIWSFGMTLLECALGRYPYDAAEGPLALMMQVLSDDTPVPETGLSVDLQDFLQQCLVKDPYMRPSAHDLLSHRFFAKTDGDGPLRLRQYLAGCRDKLNTSECKKELEKGIRDKGAQSKLFPSTSRPEDEGMLLGCAEDLAYQVFEELPKAFQDGLLFRSTSLAKLLSPQIVLSHEGVRRNGHSQVWKHLRAYIQLQASLGANKFSVNSVDTQLLQDKAVLAHVCGCIIITDVGPLAAAFLQNQPPSEFEAVLAFSQDEQLGHMTVTNLILRHL